MNETHDDRELSTYTHAHDGDQIAIFRNGKPVYFVRDVAAARRAKRRTTRTRGH